MKHTQREHTWTKFETDKQKSEKIVHSEIAKVLYIAVTRHLIQTCHWHLMRKFHLKRTNSSKMKNELVYSHVLAMEGMEVS